jgi:hypothetical protein
VKRLVSDTAHPSPAKERSGCIAASPALDDLVNHSGDNTVS